MKVQGKHAASQLPLPDHESDIADQASRAGRAAHERALAQGRKVLMRSAEGMLIERQRQQPDRVIRTLPPGTPVQVGQVLLRRKYPGPSR